MAKKAETASLLNTLGDFTSKENWDNFFSIRGTDDSFEWYSEWPNLKDTLLSHLQTLESPSHILVPGCGSSRLSEHLYDAGFHSITNIDFSKVVISDMLRRNVRDRPGMKWRVMDMTNMQFSDGTFDAVLDKGGLDALMEPELGPKLGIQYISEVKRVLKLRGKFVCLTLAESHVIGLLFSKFRVGWLTSIHAVPSKPSTKPSFRTFMVVVEKERSTFLHQIALSFSQSSLDCDENQARGLFQAFENENKIRGDCSLDSDILYSFKDLNLGAKGDLKDLIPGRRLQFNLGEEENPHFSYKAVLLDAQQKDDPFVYNCGVFLVPTARSHEWLFSSEEGQWVVTESSKAARLIMVFLDEGHTQARMDDIQKYLSPLVKRLAPEKYDDGTQIPFMMASDGVKQREIVHQVTSTMTGPIVVEDVIYENVDSAISGLIPSKDLTFRRLTFQRSLGLVQSECLLTREESECLLTREDSSQNLIGEKERRKTNSSSKSKRKGSQRSKSSVSSIDGSRNILKANHQYLASSYHTGIISGFILAASNLESLASSGLRAKTAIIGLGAGLLPMFLRQCMPCLDIEVVELDPIILNLARDYFSFTEDEQMKVHVADGIQFVREIANATECPARTRTCEHDSNDVISKENVLTTNGNVHDIHGKQATKIDILIIDADSADSSSGMTCPPEDFVAESFLLSVKQSLSEKGLFVINLVSRSPAIKDIVVSRMKAVFSQLFCLQIEEDVNEVLFALPSDNSVKEDNFAEATLKIQQLLKFTEVERIQNILDSTKNISRLK